MIHDQSRTFLYENRYFIDCNQNLEKKISSDSCLMYLCNKFATGFESGLYTSIIHIDLQKTLGAFNHEILINKTECLGFPKYIILWLESHLSTRKFKVSLTKTFSEPGKLLCTVAQRSILGLPLFLLYINGMPQAVKCELLFHADDTYLVFQFNDIKEMKIQINKNFSLICDPFVDSKLSIHFFSLQFN